MTPPHTYERNSKGSKEKVFPDNVELSAYDDWIGCSGLLETSDL